MEEQKELMTNEPVCSEVMELTQQMASLETKLKEYDVYQKQYDDFKKQLLEKMKEYEIKKFTAINGTQFTVVAESPEKTELVLKFDDKRFKEEQPEMYKQYLITTEKVTKAKSSYLRITLPKEDK